MLAGNGLCPICKASMLSTEFSVNVVLRDTIERLYPHVLLRRAVDDIQVGQVVPCYGVRLTEMTRRLRLTEFAS